MTEESRKKLSNSVKNYYINNPSARLRVSETHLGRKNTYETKLKMSLAQKGPLGNRWRGGITPLIRQIRKCFKMRQWTSDIFTRDGFTCQKCGTVGKRLHAHHIKNFSTIFHESNVKTLIEAEKYQEFWNINNGITLCEKCHMLHHGFNKKEIA